MQDLIMALDAKEREINDCMVSNRDERERLISQLSELDDQSRQADADLRRINKARNALCNLDDAEMTAADVRAMPAAPLQAPGRPYSPGRR